MPLAMAPFAGWSTFPLPFSEPQDVVHGLWTTNAAPAGDDVAGRNPSLTPRQLGPDEIVIHVITRGEVVEDRDFFPDRAFPLALGGGNFSSSHYENQPAPSVSRYLLSAKTPAGYVTVTAYFGTPTPSPRLFALAAERLRHLRLAQ